MGLSRERKRRRPRTLAFALALSYGLLVSFPAAAQRKRAPASETPSTEVQVSSPPAQTPPPPPPAPIAPQDPVESLLASLQKTPGQVDVVMEIAEIYLRTNRADKAAEILWKHVSLLPKSGMLLLIKTHQEKKEWSQVVRAANLLLSKNEKDADGLVALGSAQFARGKVTDAKEALKKALEHNPRSLPAYRALGEIYEGNPYEQRLLYQDMVEVFGERAEFLTKLCQINTADGENEQGEKVCQQAIGKDSKRPENHVNLALIAKQKGETDRARQLFKKAADRFPKSELAQFENANFLEGSKNYIEAFRYYERCVKAEAASERCLVGVGNTGVQIQKLDEAFEAFRQVCRKSGRKHAGAMRKASHLLRGQKSFDWAGKFEDLSERCSVL